MKALNPARLVGVDRSEAMLTKINEDPERGVEYIQADGAKERLPFPANTFDAAFSFYVYCETPKLNELNHMTLELNRVLKTGGHLYIVNPNSEAIGADFVSYHYDQYPELKDGDRIVCHVHGKRPYEIHDTYWSLATYEKTFRDCGFEISERVFPKAHGPGWRDETRIAPDVVYDLVKPPSKRAQHRRRETNSPSPALGRK